MIGTATQDPIATFSCHVWIIIIQFLERQEEEDWADIIVFVKRP